MEYTYQFNDGTQNTVPVNETIGKALEELDRKAENLERKERSHQYSLEAALYEGEDFADDVTPESLLDLKIENAFLKESLLSLTETQRRRFLMFADGLSEHEIAKLESVNIRAVHEAIEYAKAKLRVDMVEMHNKEN